MSLVRRAALVAIASALALAQLADNVHLAVARHAVCAEHGELVEAAADAPGTIRVGYGAEQRPTVGLGVASRAGHEHCLAWIATRQGTSPPRAAAEPQWVAPSMHAERPRALDAQSSVEPLSVAPKQSPPLS
jgi:hypothetical protein